jgi:predicted ATPase
MAIGELRPVTACLLAVRGKLANLPPGGFMIQDRGSAQLFAVPDTQEALNACEKLLADQPSARAGLMLCQVNDENVSRCEALLRHAKEGQLVVTLPVQDLLRDSPSEPIFHEIGRFDIGGRAERLFLIESSSVQREEPPEGPASTGPFIGRRRELEQLAERIASSRVVSVFGGPGIGKSALLRRFCLEHETSFEHGAWYVDLSSVTRAEQMLDAVARRLDVAQLVGETIGDAAINTLKNKSALIAIDNCQAVLPEVKKLATAIVSGCPQVALIIGSRKVPRIAGETRLRLEGLEFPAYAEDWRAMADYDAVALFLDRASAADQDFRLSAQNAVELAQLCERLDGNPLAIELVAPKVHLLTPKQILGRLEDRFLLFKEPTGENRLHETLHWSFDNLSPAARQLLACLSVFNGSFTLESASAVAAAIDLPEQGTMWAFEDLLDNSLISPGPTLASGRQFYLTETIRSFAELKAKDLPQKPEILRRHRIWCLDFISSAANELYGPRQADWLSAIDGIYPDLRSVIDAGCLPRGDLSLSVKALLACFPYFVERNYSREALALCEKVLSVRGIDRVPERARLMNMAAAFAYYLGNWRLCRTHALRSLRNARKTGNQHVEGMAWCSAGLAAQGENAVARARICYLRALSCLKPIDPIRTLTVYGNIVSLEAEMGLFQCALEHLAESQPLLESSTDLAATASLYLNGGHLHYLRGNLRQSWDWYYRSLVQASEIRSDYGALLAVRGIIPILAAWQQLEPASVLVGVCKALQAKVESLPFDEQGIFESACTRLFALLGEAEYQNALLHGQALDREQLLEMLRELDALVTA